MDQAIIASLLPSATGMVRSGTANGLKTEAEALREDVAGTLEEELGMSEGKIA